MAIGDDRLQRPRGRPEERGYRILGQDLARLVEDHEVEVHFVTRNELTY